jgi:hypothetical protein
MANIVKCPLGHEVDGAKNECSIAQDGAFRGGKLLHPQTQTIIPLIVCRTCGVLFTDPTKIPQ